MKADFKTRSSRRIYLPICALTGCLVYCGLDLGHSERSVHRSMHSIDYLPFIICCRCCYRWWSLHGQEQPALCASWAQPTLAAQRQRQHSGSGSTSAQSARR
eukprot:COSAG01_NODE_3099_length_6589_cov_2.308783_6_plen_102_part_00